MWTTAEHPLNVFHVVPVNDLREHSTEHCWCRPEWKTTDEGGKIIVHNSADGREFDEDDAEVGH